MFSCFLSFSFLQMNKLNVNIFSNKTQLYNITAYQLLTNEVGEDYHPTWTLIHIIMNIKQDLLYIYQIKVKWKLSIVNIYYTNTKGWNGKWNEWLGREVNARNIVSYFNKWLYSFTGSTLYTQWLQRFQVMWWVLDNLSII